MKKRFLLSGKLLREGGLFIVVSNLIALFKYLILQFLPHFFTRVPDAAFGFPGILLTIGGVTFPWYMIGYGEEAGGERYFAAYMTAMVLGECINFPLQRNLVFKSRGNLPRQIACYLIAFLFITCIVNSINCIWIAVAGQFVPDFVYNIGTIVLNGGVSMAVFFVVNKIIFAE